MPQPANEPKVALLSRVLVEGLTIVASILVALAADAAWDAHVMRGEEQEALTQLAEEFATNAIHLDSITSVHQRTLDGIGTLMALAPAAAEVSSDSLRTLLWLVDNWWTFNPQQGALESLVASGRLHIIRDDSLRMELAGWRGRLEDYGEDELFARSYAAGPQYEYLTSVIDWEDMYPLSGPSTWASLTGLLGESRFRSILAYRAQLLRTVVWEAKALRTVSDAIRARIQENINP